MNWLLLVAKPLLKSLVKKAVGSQTERVKDELKSKLQSGGIDALDKAVDSIQENLISAVENKLPKWAWLQGLKGKIEAAIQLHGDSLQEQIDAEVVALGPAAIDKIVDASTSLLLSRIDSL